jgi:formylglycine-generating enzyme required for sulfatase activity
LRCACFDIRRIDFPFLPVTFAMNQIHVPATMNRKFSLLQKLPLIVILSIGIAAAGMMAYTLSTALRGQTQTARKGPPGMVWIPAGDFFMGNDQRLSRPNERPAHRVRLSGFWMDQHHVTNAEFRRFVEATGYITTAERKPDWETIRVQVFPDTPKPADDQLIAGAMVFVGTPEPVPLNDWTQWWRFVPGANWQHPQGPQSNIDGKDNHPVVQVSYEDAQAYAHWAGKRLPTEAEWEFAARGGLSKSNYAWGNEFNPNGKKMANTFEGTFPVVTTKTLGIAGTTPVQSFPPNGYGLYDMAGNAWQWVADWYRSDAFQIEAKRLAESGQRVVENPQGPADSYDIETRTGPENAPSRVIRGGSFLCSEEYCTSYRPSARRGNDPFNPMSHIGFRLVMSDADWQRQTAQQEHAASASEKIITQSN